MFLGDFYKHSPSDFSLFRVGGAVSSQPGVRGQRSSSRGGEDALLKAIMNLHRVWAAHQYSQIWKMRWFEMLMKLCVWSGLIVKGSSAGLWCPPETPKTSAGHPKTALEQVRRTTALLHPPDIISLFTHTDTWEVYKLTKFSSGLLLWTKTITNIRFLLLDINVHWNKILKNIFYFIFNVCNYFSRTLVLK